MSWQLDLLRNFNVGNIISGSFQFSEIERAESPNLVRATFIDAANKYQKSVMQTEDEPDQDVRGTVIQDLDLLGVSSRDQAGRLAQIQLMKAALCGYVCSFRVSIYDCAVTCGDLCTVTHAAPGWIQKPFRIVKMVENQNDEIDITCEEYNLSIFGASGQVGTYTEYPSEPNPVTVRQPTDVPDVHRIVFTASTGLTWTAGTIYYKGIGYDIDSGGTSDAYIYFDPDVSETTLQTSATQPALGTNGWVLAYYDSANDDVYVTRIEKIIHGDLIKANTITTSTLNFVPLVSTSGTGDIVATINASEEGLGIETSKLDLSITAAEDVIVATINASAEGIRIGANKISISGSTDFTSGYDPTSKVTAVGGTYDSAASGARVRIFPDANTGIQAIDDDGNDVLKVMVGGANVGDVIIGDYDNDNGTKFYKSEGITDVAGLIRCGNTTDGVFLSDDVFIGDGIDTPAFFLTHDSIAHAFIGYGIPAVWDGPTFNIGAPVGGGDARLIAKKWSGLGNLFQGQDTYASLVATDTEAYVELKNIAPGTSPLAALSGYGDSLFNVVHATGGIRAVILNDSGDVDVILGHLVIASSTIDGVWARGGFECLAGTHITEFSIDGTLGDNSDLAVPTEKAIKTYVDGKAPKAHNLIDTTGHAVSGLTSGHFLKATGATTYAFGAHGLTASDVGAAPSANGVTNGDSHDHSGGDGAQIAYSSLGSIPSSFTPAAHKTSHQSGGTDALQIADSQIKSSSSERVPYFNTDGILTAHSTATDTDLTWAHSGYTNGKDGTITIVTDVQLTLSDIDLSIQAKTVSITITDGVVTTIGAESGWVTQNTITLP